MTVELDQGLIYETRRRTRVLSPADRLAINLFKRKGVRVPILTKVWGVSKNTIYNMALTGATTSAAETNALIEKLGEAEAWKRYVTQERIEAVNAAMRQDAKDRNESR